MPDPFGPPGSRLYRTGDRCRWRPDGNLEFLGRMDHQVKIRGFRIELGEIEAALLAMPGVSAAAVVAREDGPGGTRIVAYVVGEDAPRPEALRAALHQRLPEWMVPSAFVPLDRLPLNPSGKVDRKALPAPEREVSPAAVAPRTPVEAALAAVWAEVLDLPAVGVEDDFFVLGGHSLLATVLASRIGQRLGVQLPLRALFEAKTVAAQAALVAAAAPVSAPIPVVSRAERLPLSFASERLWFLDQLQPGTSLYHIPVGLDLRGALDVEALRLAVGDVVARHEALRTVFPVDGQGAFQHIGVPDAWYWRFEDLSRAEDAETEAARLLREEALRPFDMGAGPLLRTVLIRLGAEHHYLGLTVHHAVFDGWSTGILSRELSAAYAARSRGQAPSWSPLPVQVADVAAWEREQLQGEVLEAHLAAWRQALQDPPTLELPTDRPRAPMRSVAGTSLPVQISAEIVAALDILARQTHCTRFMVLLAAFSTLLGRLSGQDDVIVGSPVAGRTRVETEGLIGLFVNTLALRADLSGDPSFRTLLGRVREVALFAYANQDVPFEAVVDAVVTDRDPSRTPLFQAMFVLQTAEQGALRLGDVAIEVLSGASQTAKCDISLALEEHQGALVGGIEYASDLFEADTIQRWIDSLGVLLAGIAADPETRLLALPVLTEQEYQQLLVEWNNTTAPVPDGPVHALFEAQARKSPDAVAVVFEDQSLSYTQLNAAANRLAHRLQALGVGLEVRVGIGLARGLEMVVAVLGVLKAGGAYVPLDPSYPEARLRFMVEDAGLEVLITSADLVLPVPESVVRLDLDNTDLATESDQDLLWTGTPDTLAYVIYTSGSTGRPKGVAVAHRSVSAFLGWTAQEFTADELAVVVASTSLSFDVSCFELFAPLVAGGSVLVVTDVLRVAGLNGPILPTLLVTVPSAARALTGQGSLPPSILAVNLAGEALDQRTVDQLLTTFPHVRIVRDLYGPTEDTTYSTCGVRRPGQRPHIGRPIANTQLYVLDRAGRPTPIGLSGELHIGGLGLARGYLARPDLTAERFVPDPFGPAGSRLYRTGDRCRWRPDGNLEFLGRIDHQVKIRGFRIELGEIEAALLAIPGVQATVVVARDDGPGGTRLVTYVVGEDAPKPEALRASLLLRLPEWMVPSAFVHLDRLPLNPSGKVDREALPAPDREVSPAAVAPRTPVEATLAAVWAEVLSLPSVGVHDDFFALGGDSILSIQVVSRAARAGWRIRPRHVFEAPTVARLAALAEPLDGVAPRPEMVAGVGEAALTPIHRWFFQRELPVAQHYNQAIAMPVPAAWTVEILSTALHAVVAAHDALRLGFVREPKGWAARYAATPPSVSVQALDVSTRAVEDQDAAIASAADAMHASFDLREPALVRLLRVERGRSLVEVVWVIHHLVVDGVSWRILAEDLRQACAALVGGRGVVLDLPTTGWQTWASAQATRVAEGVFDDRIASWERIVHAPVGALPTVGAGASNVEYALATLDAATTDRLLREAGRPYRTEINDLLLSALAEVLQSLVGADMVGLLLEGHGREEALVPGVDLSRTVGWFTSIFPVALSLPREGGLGARIKAVKEQLRALPDRGASYGMLAWLSTNPDVQRRLALPSRGFEVVFNYLGQARGGEGALGASRTPTGRASALENPPSAPLELNAVVVDGVLGVWISADATRLGPGRAEAVARAFEGALAAVVAHCLCAGVGGLTPSDVPLSGLDQEALDHLGLSVRDLDDLLPTTPMQVGLLFHALADPGSNAYHEQFALELLGPVDEPAFEGAFAEVITRHPALRVSLVWEGLSAPLQRVHRAVQLVWTQHTVPEGADPDAALEALLAEDRARPFELSQPPLMRVGWLRVDTDRRVFVWSHHHVLMDGWSLSRVLGDLFSLYQARLSHIAVHLPAPPSLRPYAAWLERQDREQSRAFWRKRLAQVHEPSRLALPVPAVATDRTHEQTLQLDRETTSALESLARARGLTLPTVLQGAWALLLAAHSESRPVVFGVTDAGRPPELPGIEAAVGLFIITLPLVADLDPNERLSDVLAALQHQQVQAREHAGLHLAEAQRLAPVEGGEALFDTLFVYESYPVDSRLSPSDTSLRVGRLNAVERTGYALTLAVLPGVQLGLRLTAESRRLDADTLAALSGRLVALLGHIVSQPDARIGELTTLTKPERHQLLVEWNDTAAPVPNLPVHAQFEAQVRRSPDAVAVVFEDQALSYAQLNAAANWLAHRLRALGVGPEVRVGIGLQRGLEMVVAVLGVLKAGGAYVPLDPSYPEARLHFMAEDAGLAVLVSTSDLALPVPERVTRLDLDDTDLSTESDQDPPWAGTPDTLAYVIYTSGSTGNPKGAMNHHRGVVNRLDWMQDVYRLDANDAVLQKTPFSFDVSVWELLWPLREGARLVMARPEGHKDPAYLVEVIRTQHITTLHFVPSMLNAFVEAEGLESCTSLRRVVTSGEALTERHRDRLLARCEAELHNLYGPTEAAVDVTWWTCARGEVGPVPIGRPIRNTTAYIVNEHGKIVPVGVPGELLLGGVQIGRGYLGRPGLTAERFVPDPFGPLGSRLYRTGDRCRWRPDGNLEFLGRTDHQVKIRGFRIELGEIEAALLAMPGVSAAVVVARDDGPGGARLVAYVVGEDAPRPEALRAALHQRLPEWMVPSAFVHLDHLPLNPSGKVDRKALPAPDREVSPAAVAPRTPVEAALAAIWAEVLDLPSVGVHDDFFALGGDSILSIQVVSRARVAGIPLEVRDLFAHRTVAGLARLISGAAPASALWLTTLRPTGTLPPLLLMPPAGGTALAYLELTRHLPASIPVFALDAPELHPDGPQPEEVETLVASAVDQITPHLPNGVCNVGGYSAGCATAAELARQLQERGVRVEHLILVDGIPRPVSDEPFDAFEALVGWATQLGGPKIPVDMLRPIGREGAIQHVYSALHVEARARLVSPTVLDRMLNAAEQSMRRAAGFTPQPLDVPTTLLRSAESTQTPEDYHWSMQLGRQVEVIPVAGAHDQLIRSPYVEALAAAIERLLIPSTP